MFNEKINNEFASIHGRKINIDGEGIYVEELIDKGGEPYVILSNDMQISLMEAVNKPLFQESGGKNDQPFFNLNNSPGLDFDPSIIEGLGDNSSNGLMLSPDNPLTSHKAQFRQAAAYNMGQHEDIPHIPGLVADEPVNMHSHAFRSNQSPILGLLTNAKKDYRKFDMTFKADVISPSLHKVLSESYPDEDIDGKVADMIIEELMKTIKQNIIDNIDNILNSEITIKQPDESKKDNISD